LNLRRVRLGASYVLLVGKLDFLNFGRISPSSLCPGFLELLVSVTFSRRDDRFPEEHVVGFDPLVVVTNQLFDELRVIVANRIDDALQADESRELRRNQASVPIHDIVILRERDAVFARMA
jgi:hypothetical protein